MCSGKSSLLRWLSSMHDGIYTLSMDELRTMAFLNYSMRTEPREEWARREVMARIKSHSTSNSSMGHILALERIGTGKFDGDVDALITTLDLDYKRVLVDTSPRTCLLWQQQRKPPIYPRPHYMSDPEVFIYRTAEMLKDRRCSEKYDAVIPGAQAQQLKAEQLIGHMRKWGDGWG